MLEQKSRVVREEKTPVMRWQLTINKWGGFMRWANVAYFTTFPNCWLDCKDKCTCQYKLTGRSCFKPNWNQFDTEEKRNPSTRKEISFLESRSGFQSITNLLLSVVSTQCAPKFPFLYYAIKFTPTCPTCLSSHNRQGTTVVVTPTAWQTGRSQNVKKQMWAYLRCRALRDASVDCRLRKSQRCDHDFPTAADGERWRWTKGREVERLHFEAAARWRRGRVPTARHTWIPPLDRTRRVR